MRTGGTQKYPADTLDEIIDLLALQFGFSAGESQFTFNASFLSEYTDNAFAIIREMLFHPVFDAKKLEKERAIMTESVRHRFDNPGPTLSMAYDKQMYCKQAAGRMITEASIKNITQKDLDDLHRVIVSPVNMILGISGAFNRDSMKTRLEKLLTSDIPLKGEAPLPKVTINRPVRTLFIHKPISQAYVRLGLPLFQRPHPDFYAMSLLNEILGGGGFTSRLGEKIRSDEGLTYSIHSTAESNYTYPGTFRIDFFTKNESFTHALTLTLAEVRKIVATGVTDKELANAKSSVLGELPSMFRSPDDIVTTYGWNEYYHRAPDHFRVYTKKIREITKDDLLRVAKTYLKPDSMTITVVGDSTALLRQKTDDFSLAKLKPKILLPEAIPALP
jgi:zinc protease